MSEVVWNLGPNGPNHHLQVLGDVLHNGTIFVQNATGFVLKFGVQTIGFPGSFTVNGGVITGGTISGFKIADNGVVLVDASGYAIDVNDFNQALTLFNLNNVDPLQILLLGNPMTVNGTNGPDLAAGGFLSDHMYGKGGLDVFFGSGGDDFISGGPGVDEISGDKGSDTADYSEKSVPIAVILNGLADPNVAVDATQVRVGGVVEDALRNIENINGGSASDTITGDVLANKLVGNAGDDTLAGMDGNDVLEGSEGKDLLQGGDGNDQLRGGAGEDGLFGNLGADTQTGGAGPDTFVFLALTDSTKNAAGRDTILDFNRAQGDEIDLSAIDAKNGKGNQEFKFIKKQGFHDQKGELRYKVKDGDALVQGDTDGNGKADFAIVMDSINKLKGGDFDL